MNEATSASERRIEPPQGAELPRCDARVSPVNGVFRKLAYATARDVGRPWAFAAALGTIVVWAITGPLFHYSDTWQLVINTGTTIITFLMVFLIQSTQNRDSHEIHLKLDELIRVNRAARNRLIGLEQLSDDEIADLQGEFDRLAQRKLAERASRPPRNPAAKPPRRRKRQSPSA